jgi:biotin synthase-related radical SAM superfamily protein
MTLSEVEFPTLSLQSGHGLEADHDPLGRLTAYCLTEVASKESAGDLVRTLEAIRSADANAEMVSEDSINTLGYAHLCRRRDTGEDRVRLGHPAPFHGEFELVIMIEGVTC